LIELLHISKRFGALAALDDVSLAIPPRRILGLLGENGAGKSTLMHVLFGMLRAEGTIRVRGNAARIRSPRAAQRLGIGMVHQHFKLVPTLTAVENFALFLGGWLARSAKVQGTAEQWLARLQWRVPLNVAVGDLAVGQQQRIEIIKALMGIQRRRAGGGTLILDEPTAVLTPQETQELFVAMRALRDSGNAVVFISHKLNEVRQICDDIAILRRGKLVHAGPAAGLSPEAMAEKMVGTRVEMPVLRREDAHPRPPSATARTETLAIRNAGTHRLRSVSLSVREGEILGIAGVDGNGQSHLAQTILGILKPTSGQIFLRGQAANRFSPRRRLHDIAFIAEDRQKEALVLQMSVEDNLMLKDYRQPAFNTLGWLRFGAWRSQSRELIKLFDIRAAAPTVPAGRLSGGNQQKIVLARELHGTKPIVLAVNPTRGLDVGATAFVLQKLLDARARGAAVLLIHSDLDELLAISDRVAVLFNGTLTETRWPETTRDAIGRLMLGLPAEAAA
jgi:simple sugar transport system ATP-binding protein